MNTKPHTARSATVVLNRMMGQLSGLYARVDEFPSCKTYVKTAMEQVGYAMRALQEDPPTNGPKAYLCAVCKRNPVDAEAGYDTCDQCLAHQ